jgi:putative ABC transport system substrate-binding protein
MQRASWAFHSSEVPFRNPVELVRGIDEFAVAPNGGLIIAPAAAIHLETILPMATQHRLPTVCGATTAAKSGVMIGYAPDATELWQRGASFIDRILRGAQVGDLPLEYPTRFQLEINLKTAKALGLTVPPSIRLRANEVIE